LLGLGKAAFSSEFHRGEKSQLLIYRSINDTSKIRRSKKEEKARRKIVELSKTDSD